MTPQRNEFRAPKICAASENLRSEDGYPNYPPARALNDDFFNHSSVNVRQPEIATGVAVRKFFVIETQEVQDGRVQVVHVDHIFGSLKPKFVGGTIDRAALDPAAGQPH